jgi:hypothetical protein
VEQDRAPVILPHHSQLAGGALETLEIVVNLIGNTRTDATLEVHAWIEKKNYEKTRKESERKLSEVIIRRNKFHEEWNYEIYLTQ